MRTFAMKSKRSQKTVFPKFKAPGRASSGHNHEGRANPLSQHTFGNQMRLMKANGMGVKNASAATENARSGNDISRIQLYAKRPAERAVASKMKESVESSYVNVQGVRTFEFNRDDLNSAPQVSDSVAVSEKSVEGGEQNFIGDLLVERALEKNGDGGAVPAAPAPAAPAKVKKAGVVSFEVKWTKPAGAGEANAKLRLDYKAKFKKDADHDPALADFRQSVTDEWDITAGPHRGRKGKRAKRDDNYSRADDVAGNAITDVDFQSNDNPGYDDLHKDDVFDYSFTAEQTIIDTSQADKEIAKRGPHTATIKGKHPRAYAGLPKTLS